MGCWGWFEKLLFAWPGHMNFCRTQSTFLADIVSSVVGKAERRSHLPDCMSCFPPSLLLLHKPALTAALSSSLDLESHTTGDSESEVSFPLVKLQPESACRPESESPNPPDFCNDEARCDISSPDSTPASSCGTCVSPCEQTQCLFTHITLGAVDQPPNTMTLSPPITSGDPSGETALV